MPAGGRAAPLLRCLLLLAAPPLARGQTIQCGEPVPVYSAAAYATSNGNPSGCPTSGPGSYAAMTAACRNDIPATYTSSPYGAGSTEAMCQADLCRAEPACTAAIEAWGNALEACNPQGNYMATLFMAKAWRDACVGESLACRSLTATAPLLTNAVRVG